MHPELGICQWFHYEAYDEVERTADRLREMGVKLLRTGVSWADFHRPNGQEWYDWQFKALADFELLVSVWHTPPSIAEGAKCAGPPLRLRDYADFIWQLLDRYGESIAHLELWNEPNNRLKWDFQNHDPMWEKFGRMIDMAAATAHEMDTPTVLGGMIPVDHHWLNLMKEYGALEHIDIVAIHGFPGMWWEGSICWEWQRDWRGWQQKIDYIAAHAEGRPIWITETGCATWDLEASRRARYDMQTSMLEQVADAPTDRVYWYTLFDLDPQLEAIEGFHVDENEYHMGLIEHNGQPKPAQARFGQLNRRNRQRAARLCELTET